MKNVLIFLLFSAFVISGFSQQNFTLTFSGVNNTSYVQLDSIKVVNRSQQCDTVIYWPDTVLNLPWVGIQEYVKSGFDVHVLYANPGTPLSGMAISIEVPEKDNIRILLTDISGRSYLNEHYLLAPGIHQFYFHPGASRFYVLSVSGIFGSQSVKIINNTVSNAKIPDLEYSGMKYEPNQMKSENNSGDFNFMPGDTLLVSGYQNAMESPLIDDPYESKIYMLQFAYNIPCPGTPTIVYGGQEYNTVQIFNQCWLKENLNFEKGNSWCYNFDPANCDIYGRLYNWETALTVCPDGWHLPSDAEWKILEGVADSQFAPGDAEWDNSGLRGFDVGKNLKSDSGWNSNGSGVDLYGFSALPGGYRYYPGDFYSIGDYAYWWTSDVYPSSSQSTAWNRRLFFGNSQSNRYDRDKGNGFSVRCLKDK
jgi:uncharacterized protein (TIGR02145 family)